MPNKACKPSCSWGHGASGEVAFVNNYMFRSAFASCFNVDVDNIVHGGCIAYEHTFIEVIFEFGASHSNFSGVHETSEYAEATEVWHDAGQHVIWDMVYGAVMGDVPG